MRSTLHDPLLTPEHRLWRAVLEQAYVDAESSYDIDHDDDGDGPPERIRARCYLRGDSRPDAASLALVCDFAEIPADRVLDWARRNYPRPPKQPAFGSHTLLRNSLVIGAPEARQSRARSRGLVSA